MIQLIALIIITAFIAYFIKKRIDEVLPVIFMASMLLTYLFGIAGKLKISVVGVLIIGGLFVLFLFFRQRMIKQSFSVETFKANFKQYVFTPQILICLVVCTIFCLIFSTHRVFFWDDLSYWAIYTKNLFFLNELPLGVENCSISYKDYTPLMQITEYFFLYGKAEFSEPMLFQTNICFAYILLLPILGSLKERKMIERIGLVVLYVVFPHIIATQFYYKLGVDYILGILFGYVLLAIVDATSNRAFYYTKIVIAMAFLSLVKTSGIVLVLFAALFFAIYHWKKTATFWNASGKLIINGLKIVFIPTIFYLSWKIFAEKTGNTGYLSERIETNVRSLAHLFPDYTGTVILDYIKHVFTYPLTREVFGMTAFGIIIFIAVVYYLQKYCKMIDARAKRLHIAMSIGLFVFCLAHIYMYLFVFDEWEAMGLLEYDRYIGQYLAGVFLFYICNLWDTCEQVKKKRNWSISPAWCFVIILLMLLPYPSINTYLLPGRFDAYFEEKCQGFVDSAKTEWETSGIKDLDIPTDEEHKVMLVANAWMDELQYFTYCAVPQPFAFVANVPAIENGKLADFISTQAERRNISYAYVMYNAETSYQGDYMLESRELVTDGEILKGGEIYTLRKEEPWKLELYQ